MIATGTPEQVSQIPGSYTGQFLAEVLPVRARSARKAAGTALEVRRCRRVSPPVAAAKLWAQKWRWYQRNALPWNRARIHLEFMRREAFVRWPVHGDVLTALQEGRLEIGAHAFSSPASGSRRRVRPGCGSVPARFSTWGS